MLKYLEDILHNPSTLQMLTWQLLLYKSINLYMTNAPDPFKSASY